MKNLFTEFPKTSTEDWENIVHRDLKGADYNKKLITKTYENISLKPYYRKEDVARTLSTNKQSNDWHVQQTISDSSPTDSNKRALNYLNRGLTSLSFKSKINTEFIDGINIKNQNDLKQLLNKILLEHISVSFDTDKSSIDFYSMLSNLYDKQELSTISGALNFDPIQIDITDGNVPELNINILKEAINFANEHSPNFKLFTVNGCTFANSGSTAVQELAFTLSKAVEYISIFQNAGLNAQKIVNQLSFSFGIGSNYFMEIAKLRAVRVLWESILNMYGLESEMEITSTPNNSNKSIYDTNVNMLRLTTEAMSAAIGGTNTLNVPCFDTKLKDSTEFSDRVSRNIQLILKGESYLDKTSDPAHGSYYLESLTNELIQETLELFQSIEKDGGFIESIKKGTIQTEIAEIVNIKKKNVETRKDIILGTNQYPDLDETIDTPSLIEEDKTSFENVSFSSFDELRAHYQNGGNRVIHRQVSSGKITPIPSYDASTSFDELRLKTESVSKKPKVFLLTYGNLAMRKARSVFALNFFGCAGFEVIDNPGFDSIEKACTEAKTYDSDIVVICSSDQEYESIVPEICDKFKESDMSIILAGYPKDKVEEYTKNGIDDFIHVRSNALEILKKYQEKHLN